MTDPSAGPSSPSPAERAIAKTLVETILALCDTHGPIAPAYAERTILPLICRWGRSVEERTLRELLEHAWRTRENGLDAEFVPASVVRSRLASLKETRER